MKCKRDLRVITDMQTLFDLRQGITLAKISGEHQCIVRASRQRGVDLFMCYKTLKWIIAEKFRNSLFSVNINHLTNKDFFIYSIVYIGAK